MILIFGSILITLILYVYSQPIPHESTIHLFLIISSNHSSQCHTLCGVLPPNDMIWLIDTKHVLFSVESFFFWLSHTTHILYYYCILFVMGDMLWWYIMWWAFCQECFSCIEGLLLFLSTIDHLSWQQNVRDESNLMILMEICMPVRQHCVTMGLTQQKTTKQNNFFEYSKNHPFGSSFFPLFIINLPYSALQFVLIYVLHYQTGTFAKVSLWTSVSGALYGNLFSGWYEPDCHRGLGLSTRKSFTIKC